ncbi:peptidase inhibitor family I36 protein [Micromonospora sp. NPDC004704]
MRKHLPGLLGLALAGILAATAIPAPASAAPAAEPSVAVDPAVSASQTVEQQIDRMLGYPGAKRIDRYTVEMTKGAFVTIPDPSGGASTMANCNFRYLCLWSERDFVGPRITFTTCGLGVENFGPWPFPNGGVWSDKVSSIMNNQTSGTWSGFYDWRSDGGGWDDLKFLKAYGYWRDLSKDKADDGSHMNDRIDAVQTC